MTNERFLSYRKYELLLKRDGTNSYQVSKATGIAEATLSQWKYGKYMPKIDKMKLIADHFHVPVDYFYGD